MKTISEWLSNIDSHGIYDAEPCAKDFTSETGKEPCWPTHSVAATKQAIQARGVGGSVNGKSDERVCYGYEIAESCAEKYAHSTAHQSLQGRGSRFRVAVMALENVKL